MSCVAFLSNIDITNSQVIHIQNCGSNMCPTYWIGLFYCKQKFMFMNKSCQFYSDLKCIFWNSKFCIKTMKNFSLKSNSLLCYANCVCFKVICSVCILRIPSSVWGVWHNPKVSVDCFRVTNFPQYFLKSISCLPIH